MFPINDKLSFNAISMHKAFLKFVKFENGIIELIDPSLDAHKILSFFRKISFCASSLKNKINLKRIKNRNLLWELIYIYFFFF